MIYVLLILSHVGKTGCFIPTFPPHPIALIDRLDYLRTSRPTAVNLANACEVLKKLITAEATREGSTGSSTIEAFVAASEAMMEEDVAANRRQGEADGQARNALFLCSCFCNRRGYRTNQTDEIIASPTHSKRVMNVCAFREPRRCISSKGAFGNRRLDHFALCSAL